MSTKRFEVYRVVEKTERSNSSKFKMEPLQYNGLYSDHFGDVLTTHGGGETSIGDVYLVTIEKLPGKTLDEIQDHMKKITDHS